MPGDRHVHQVPARRRPRRRTVVAALLTGASPSASRPVLTGGELALGGSSVGGGHARTTLFGGQGLVLDPAPGSATRPRRPPAGRRTTSRPATTTAGHAPAGDAARRRDGYGRHSTYPGDAAERRHDRASRGRDDDDAGADDDPPPAPQGQATTPPATP